jgi:hypothetical protein
MPYIERLTSAPPLGGHRLALTFADGFTASLDLEPALEGPLFAPLLDPAAFRAVTVEDGVPVWPCGADMDPSTLRIWAESGRVLSDEETSSAPLIERRTLAQI